MADSDIKKIPQSLVVTGIDTGVGKTVVAAALALRMGAAYWKPVQAGTAGETDSAFVRRVSQPAPPVILPEAYRLRLPQSPHWAAEEEGRRISLDRLAVPAESGPLVIEGAGGVMVPLNEESLFVDLFARWQRPVVVVVRLYLGCINHSLLTLEVLRRRRVPIAGILYNGTPQPKVQAAIEGMGGAPVLGHLPELSRLDRAALLEASASWRLDGLVA